MSTPTAYKLATADKRGSVRIWRITTQANKSGEQRVTSISLLGVECQVELESILIGHSDVVSSVHWGQQDG